ncbi:MAG: carbohydrate ABC transporter permease [Eubacteriales bacterium]|nr:carbohydrate ABC transporter permease [Eubacteriales bacterium]
MKQSLGERLFSIFNIVILIVFALATLYPFLYVVAVSLSDSAYVNAGQVTFFPRGWNATAYQVALKDSNFWTGYCNTIFYTVVGTFFSMALTVLLAYPLSKRSLAFRKPITLLAMGTMFFSGGMIPNFLLVRSLNMLNTVWAILIPGALSTWNMILVRTFFEGIPTELEDAAAIDGLNPFQIMLKIYLPLSIPVLATVSLFYAVNKWNSWFSAFLYLKDMDKMPVTIFLRNVLVTASNISTENALFAKDNLLQLQATIKCAVIVMVSAPILVAYPFVQRFFVKGIMVGAIKG